MTFLFGFLHFNWRLVGEPVLVTVAFIDGAILMVMSQSSHAYVAYLGYWAYKAFYHFLIAVASYEIASNIREDSYGLAFGINTFLALAFQTLLTVVVADNVGLALPPRTQVVISMTKILPTYVG